MKKALALFGFILLILCLDFFSKAYVHENLPLMNWLSSTYPYGGIGVFCNWHGIDFSINHVVNKGAAWGILASWQQFLVYGRIMVIGGLITYLCFFQTSLSRQIAFASITAGAIGNVFDYFIYGHVVDMFHFRFWGYTYPVFNVADSAIFCGVAFLLLQATFEKLKNRFSYEPTV